MSSEHSKRAGRKRPSATAAGFLAAFGLSVATIIYTGLKVGAPLDSADPPSSAAAQPTQADERDRSGGADGETTAPDAAAAPAREAAAPDEPDAGATSQ